MRMETKKELLMRLTDEILDVVKDENFTELPLTIYYALEEAYNAKCEDM